MQRSREWTFWGGVVLAGLIAWGYQREQRREHILTEQVRLKDSVYARYANAQIERDSLKDLLKAAKQLNGKLLAGVRVKVPGSTASGKRDSLPTTLYKDSTRTAVVHDSTSTGTLDAVITAPPCCAPLGFSYTYRTNPLNPQVGFVQTKGGAVYAVVTGLGDSIKVQAPYFKPTRQQPMIEPYIAAGLNTATELYAGGGAMWNLPGKFQVYGEGRFQAGPLQMRPLAEVGLRKKF